MPYARIFCIWNGRKKRLRVAGAIMKPKLYSLLCLVALGAVLHAFTRVDLGRNVYDTQYIAMYDDGHTELVMHKMTASMQVVSTFVHGGSKWEVTSVMDYWYDGLELGTQYYITKVRLMK